MKSLSTWLATACLAFAISGCGGGGSSGPSTAPVTPPNVPNVVGQSQAAATSAITAAGLTLGTVTMQSSGTVASGNVISESPAAATSVANGSAVNLVVSSGPPQVAVPNVVGDLQAAATSAITAAGLTLGTVTMQSSGTVASGNVISESPAATTSVASGSAVNLVVSSGAAPAAWTWMSGSNLIGASGVYGSQGVTSASNVPGARFATSAWSDSSGNFWLFGGECYDSTAREGYCNDLWKYSPSSAGWTWVGGSNVVNGLGVYGAQGVASASNVPGARNSAGYWTDSSGNLWLFGGVGCYSDVICGLFNDLWKYSPSSGEWTWVGGSNATLNAAGVYGTQGVASASNMPGVRTGELTWTDASGNLWLFGGTLSGAVCTTPGVVCGDFNDLWKYDPTSGEWTWVSGSNVVCVVSGQVSCPGVYGTQGVASASSLPGGRHFASTWTDSSGNLWLFGGSGTDSTAAIGWLNDLWKYSPSTGEWTWVGGSNVLNAVNLVNTGVYGTQGVPSASNVPGGRFGANSWIDPSGNLWLFGGNGVDSTGEPGELNDLWKYSPSSAEWTWVSGLNVIVEVMPGQTQGVYIDQGVYGTQGVASASNMPGGREGAISWTDSSGNLWLFGGDGLDSTSTGNIGSLNDLWRFTPAQ